MVWWKSDQERSRFGQFRPNFERFWTLVELNKKRRNSSSFNFQYFSIKPPQKILSYPYKLIHGNLIKFWPRTAKIRPFLGRISFFFNLCEIELKRLEILPPSIFNLFYQTTTEISLWFKCIHLRWFDQSRTKNSWDLAIFMTKICFLCAKY